MSKLHNTVTTYFTMTAIGFVGIVAALHFGIKLTLLLSWIVSATVLTFLLFGIDKGLAGKSGRVRLPEALLHFMAFIGGTVGAFAGAFLFHHKVSKRPFMVKLYVIAIIQILAVIGVWYGFEGRSVVSHAGSALNLDGN